MHQEFNMVLSKAKLKKKKGDFPSGYRPSKMPPPESVVDQQQHQADRQNKLLPIDVLTLQTMREILDELRKITKKLK